MHELDEVLARFQLCDVEYAGGLSNHGPMAAEAIVALGHQALLVGFMDVYAPRLQPLPTATPIPREDRSALLGANERAADWIATYEVALAEQPWRKVLVREVEWLADGVFAAAGHAWLRVAHAVRALRTNETHERLRELAFGLGYWASHHQSLPGEPGSRSADETGFAFDPAAHLRDLTPLPPAGAMLFTEAAKALATHEPFLDCTETFRIDGSVDEAIGRLCVEAADLYLRYPLAPIPYIHALTVPSSLRLVSDLLPAPLCERLYGRLFQASAAFHAIGSATADGESQSDPAERDRLASSPDELRYRAACSLEEHAIKFAEACLREHSLSPDARLLRAAADAVLRLDSGRY